MTLRIDFAGDIIQSTQEAQDHGVPNLVSYSGHFIYDDTIVHDNIQGIFHHYEDFHDEVTAFEFNVADITLGLSDVTDARISISDNRVYAVFNIDIEGTSNKMGISRIIPFQLGHHTSDIVTVHPKTPIFTTLDKDTFTSTTSHINVHPVGYATGNLTSLIFT